MAARLCRQGQLTRHGGPSFSPADLSGLVLWLDADDAATITEAGGDVSQWDDKSASGIDVANATAAQQPNTDTASGRNSAYFDGGDRLTASGFAADTLPSDEMTLAAVLTPDDAAGAEDFITTHAPPGALRFAVRKTGTTIQGFWNGGGGTTLPLAGAASAGETVWVIFRHRPSGDGDDDALDSNGTTNSVTENGALTGATQLSVGATIAGGTPFSGHIHELIYVDRFIADAERDDLEAYLNDKWGL